MRLHEILWLIATFLALNSRVAWAQSQTAPQSIALHPLQFTSSNSADHLPSFDLVLHERSGDQLKELAVTPELRQRLDSLLDADQSVHFQKIEGSRWGFRVQNELLSLRDEALLTALTEAFTQCISALSSLEQEALKSVLYNLSEQLTLNGELQLPRHASDALIHMQESFQKDGCAQGTEPLPTLTRVLAQRYVVKLFSGQDPEGALDEEGTFVLRSIVGDLFWGPEGIWQRVAQQAIEKKLSQALRQKARPDRLLLLDKSYASFVDFVLTSRVDSFFTREDYLAVAEACGIKQWSAFFSRFDGAACRAAGRLQLIQFEVEEKPQGLFVMDRSAL